MKDMPAMESATPVTISSSLTADVGTDFLNVLDTTQKALVTGLTDIQRNDLLEIVSTRRLISTQLRRFITESSVDNKTTVLTLAKRYGELDGEIVYNYANNFVNVSKTMTDAQKAQLLPILSKYSWDRIACTGAYLYSEKLSVMPDIDAAGKVILSSYQNTDYFFTTDTTTAPSSWFSFSPSTTDYQSVGNIHRFIIRKPHVMVMELRGRNHQHLTKSDPHFQQRKFLYGNAHSNQCYRNRHCRKQNYSRNRQQQRSYRIVWLLSERADHRSDSNFHGCLNRQSHIMVLELRRWLRQHLTESDSYLQHVRHL